MRLFLDINVILDVLADRQPWAEDSAAVLSLCESSEVDGFIAAHSVTTLHFLLDRHARGRRARTAIIDLLELVAVAAVDESVLLRALSLGWPDFEDAVQAVCAIQVEANYLITRNTRDYRDSPIPALTPGDFLALMTSAAEKPARPPRQGRSR